MPAQWFGWAPTREQEKAAQLQFVSQMMGLAQNWQLQNLASGEKRWSQQLLSEDAAKERRGKYIGDLVKIGADILISTGDPTFLNSVAGAVGESEGAFEAFELFAFGKMPPLEERPELPELTKFGRGERGYSPRFDPETGEVVWEQKVAAEPSPPSFQPPGMPALVFDPDTNSWVQAPGIETPLTQAQQRREDTPESKRPTVAMRETLTPEETYSASEWPGVLGRFGARAKAEQAIPFRTDTFAGGLHATTFDPVTGKVVSREVARASLEDKLLSDFFQLFTMQGIFRGMVGNPEVNDMLLEEFMRLADKAAAMMKTRTKSTVSGKRGEPGAATKYNLYTK